MREIKFRAWDTYRKKMWSAEEMGEDELTINPDGRGFVNVSGDSPKMSRYMIHMIPLQYTGLADKNDQEIYEGAIIEIKEVLTGANWPNPGFIIEKINIPVIWDKKNALWSFDIEHDVKYSEYYDKNDIRAKTTFRNHIRALMFDGKSGKIIGNIYENPELLKGE